MQINFRSLLLWGGSLLASFTLSAQTAADQAEKDALLQLQKFNQFYRYLNATYVDSVQNAPLVEKAIREMLLGLDPHSTYLTAEEMKGVKEIFDGSFSGIGIEFNVLQDTIIVVNVIAGGPSQKVGLTPNDRIIAVNDTSVIGKTQWEVPKILRGPKGTRADLKVVRRGVAGVLDFSIVRDNIPINTVDAAYKIDSKTGYIRINRFANNTFSEFMDAYKKFGSIDALILDLRSNGGGLLDQAIELSNFFLEAGNTIVSTEGLHMRPSVIKADQNGLFTHGKVIVLVNETSASASEIVSGALQDWDRGMIIGRRTFGKGLVQRQFPLIDSSAIRITVARYHTPTGRAIQRPYQKGKGDAYQQEFISRFNKDGDTTHVDSSRVYRTLRSGRTVYGGGGITPDLVVETDTTQYSNYLAQLIRNGILNEFTIAYMDKHRKALERDYPTFETFETKFQTAPALLDELTALATQRKISFNKEEFERSAPLIRIQIKALLAQKLWGFNEYFRVMNGEHDEVMTQAIQTLRNWNATPQTQGILY